VFTATLQVKPGISIFKYTNNTALYFTCNCTGNNAIDQLNNGSGLDIEQITSTIYTQAEVNSFF